MRTQEYLESELRQWDVDWTIGKGGKHMHVLVRYRGQQRKIFFSFTPVAGRAVKNNIANARRVLRDMGAKRKD